MSHDAQPSVLEERVTEVIMAFIRLIAATLQVLSNGPAATRADSHEQWVLATGAQPVVRTIKVTGRGYVHETPDLAMVKQSFKLEWQGSVADYEAKQKE